MCQVDQRSTRSPARRGSPNTHSARSSVAARTEYPDSIRTSSTTLAPGPRRRGPGRRGLATASPAPSPTLATSPGPPCATSPPPAPTCNPPSPAPSPSPAMTPASTPPPWPSEPSSSPPCKPRSSSPATPRAVDPHPAQAPRPGLHPQPRHHQAPGRLPPRQPMTEPLPGARTAENPLFNSGMVLPVVAELTASQLPIAVRYSWMRRSTGAIRRAVALRYSERFVALVRFLGTAAVLSIGLPLPADFAGLAVRACHMLLGGPCRWVR
jgi:hypothetical protein